MRRNTRLPFLALLSVFAMTLNSCGVLTVDVDVYKGPLANREDVQMEQLAVMAIAAKPLLVEYVEGDYPESFRIRGSFEADGAEVTPANSPVDITGLDGTMTWDGHVLRAGDSPVTIEGDTARLDCERSWVTSSRSPHQ